MAAFDVIVIGGGHAGCEAAAAAARMGASTALAHPFHRHDRCHVLQPGHRRAWKGTPRARDRCARRVDGAGWRIAAGIQFRMLNRRKGPAVRGPRAQADRKLYREAMQAAIVATDNLCVIEGEADDLEIANGRIRAVVTTDGRRFGCGSVVLTTGTFLKGLIHIGDVQIPAGRGGGEAGAWSFRYAGPGGPPSRPVEDGDGRRQGSMDGRSTGAGYRSSPATTSRSRFPP